MLWDWLFHPHRPEPARDPGNINRGSADLCVTGEATIPAMSLAPIDAAAHAGAPMVPAVPAASQTDAGAAAAVGAAFLLGAEMALHGQSHPSHLAMTDAGVSSHPGGHGDSGDGGSGDGGHGDGGHGAGGPGDGNGP